MRRKFYIVYVGLQSPYRDACKRLHVHKQEKDKETLIAIGALYNLRVVGYAQYVLLVIHHAFIVRHPLTLYRRPPYHLQAKSISTNTKH